MTTPRREARVLVVDDEENIRRLLRAILTRMPQQPCMVQEASNAEEGMEMLDRQAFDLVISDYRMEERTGVDLLAHAHDVRPSAARMLITAFGELDIGVEAINRGHVDGFLRKPWENARLVALVDSLLAPRLSAPLPGATVPAESARAVAAPAPAVAIAAHPPSIVTPAPAAVAGTKSDLEQEVAQIDRLLRQLRVRLGLGSISPEGYQLAANELGAKKADLELKLLKQTAR